MYKQPENQAYEVPLCERLDVVPLDARLIIEHKQPEALRLADEMEESDRPWSKGIAQELRRLHQVNQELVEALKYYAHESDYEGRIVNDGGGYFDQMGFEILDDKGQTARAALAKHKEQA